MVCSLSSLGSSFLRESYHEVLLMFNFLCEGLLAVFQPLSFALMCFGVMMGTIIGAIPGLSGSMGIILLLPLVYQLPSDVALVMLCGLYCGSMYGGSVSAILLKAPGTPSAAATVLDGNPLANKGLAGKAIGVSAFSSFIGGLISTICLIFISPQLAKIALSFNAADFFSLSIFGLSIMASSSSKKVMKGVLSGCVGLLISTVGIDPIVGNERFTFGNYRLMNGFPILPVLIGIFAISEIFINLRDRDNPRKNIEDQKIAHVFPSLKDIRFFLKASIVGGVLGVLIGIIPGTGGAIACFLAYNVAQKISKKPEDFGNGSLEGIAAPEAANNGTTGGALIPMLSLGIPGDVVTSVMLGALVLIGVRPGPMLFVDNPKIVYTLFAGMFIVQFLMLFFGMGFAKFAPKVLKIPAKVLMPMILMLCVVGSFSLANQLYHVAIAVAFGVIGYFMKSFGLPGAPLVLGVIFGPIAEENLNRALIVSNNNYATFFTRPISLFFLIMAAISIGYAVYANRRDAKRG